MCSFFSVSDVFYKLPHGPLVTERRNRKGKRWNQEVPVLDGNTSV